MSIIINFAKDTIMKRTSKPLIVLSMIALTTCTVWAWQDKDWHEGLPKQHDSEFLVHDYNRPKPKTVTPGETAASPPADAIVLFDGSNLDAFHGAWKVENGYAEVNGKGDLKTKREFGDVQLHLEFATPSEVKGKDQGRGNSGVFFMDRYELQILDTYDNETYADGYLGAVYGQHPPLVNAARKPGEWQMYDIIFTRPRFDDSGKVVTPGYITAFLNGVIVQNHAEIYGGTAWRTLASYQKHGDKGPIRIQDHGNPVRIRNVWVRELE
jgi:hypothetical protein